MSHDCQCGKPIQDTANLCPPCVDTLRTNLHKIADRWAELEDALTWRLVPKGTIGKAEAEARTLDGERKLALATGSTFNEQAAHARRKATDAVWYALQVIRDDLDSAGRPFTPPRLSGSRSQDQTPTLARWIATWQLAHVSHTTDPESAAEILRDVAKAERATFGATHPTGEHWVPVHVTCESHGTTEEGERVPCPGSMWALVGNDITPDLVCDADQSHVVDPGVWERSGWKRRVSGPLHPAGMTRLMHRIMS